MNYAVCMTKVPPIPHQALFPPARPVCLLDSRITDLRANPRAKKFTGLTYTASAHILRLITLLYFIRRTHSREKAGASCPSSSNFRETESLDGCPATPFVCYSH